MKAFPAASGIKITTAVLALGLLMGLAACGFRSGGGVAATGFEAWEGVAAPDISVTTIEGKPIKLSDLKGQRVVLDFWATWCPPCVAEIPHFIQLRKDTPADQLTIVGISNEDVALLKKYVADNKLNYPIVTAENLPAPYGKVSAIPTTFFIDRKGVIQHVAVGYHDLAALKELALGADYAGPAKTAP